MPIFPHIQIKLIITYKPLILVLLSAQMAVSSVRSEGKRLYNITIYRKLFPPQLVSPDLEPLKKNPTLCQKIYYCHPLGCTKSLYGHLEGGRRDAEGSCFGTCLSFPKLVLLLVARLIVDFIWRRLYERCAWVQGMFTKI